MPKLFVPKDYVDHEIAELRRELREWRAEVIFQLEELGRGWALSSPWLGAKDADFCHLFPLTCSQYS